MTRPEAFGRPVQTRRAPIRPQPPGRCEYGLSVYGLTAFDWTFLAQLAAYLIAIRCTRPRVWISWAPAGEMSVLQQDGTVSRRGLDLLRRYMDHVGDRQVLHLTYQPNWHTGAGVPEARLLASVAAIHRELADGPVYTADAWNELNHARDNVRLAAEISKTIRATDPRVRVSVSSAGSREFQALTWGAYAQAGGIVDFLPSHTPRHDATQGEVADPWFRALRQLTADAGVPTLPLWNDEPFRAGDGDAGGGDADPTLLDYEQDARGAAKWCRVHVLHTQVLFGPTWLSRIKPAERQALPKVARWLGIPGATETASRELESVAPEGLG